MYGEGAVTNQRCQKWFANFHTGDFLLDNAPQSGRSVEVGTNQVEAIIESNQHYTMRETTDILKIPNFL